MAITRSADNPDSSERAPKKAKVEQIDEDKDISGLGEDVEDEDMEPRTNDQPASDLYLDTVWLLHVFSGSA